MDLKEEIALLERKLELLKLIKQAQDQIGQPQPVYVPYPVYTARATIHTGSL